MSRGLGRVQRGVIEALERHEEGVYLVDLQPEPHTPAGYSALHRAVKRLVESGKVDVFYHAMRMGAEPDVLVKRPGQGSTAWPKRTDGSIVGPVCTLTNLAGLCRASDALITITAKVIETARETEALPASPPEGPPA